MEKTVLPLRNFRLLYYLGILERLQHLIIQFPLCYLLVVAYRRLKTEENFALLALKVAYERKSLTRGSQCSDLTEKRFVFWKPVAEERWSQPEVRLYLLAQATPRGLSFRMKPWNHD